MPVLTAEQAISKVNRLHSRLSRRREDVEEYDDFYEGKQPLKFASREWSDFHKDRYTGFSDNWCGVVPDALNERLGITAIQAGEKRTSEDDALWRAWEENDLPAQSSQGFLQASTAKRSFVLVWADRDGDPIVTWEHPGSTIVEYDAANPRVRTFALKTWVDDKTEFAILYEPAALWKFKRPVSEVKVRNGVTSNGIHLIGSSTRTDDYVSAWEPWQPASDDIWPLPNMFGKVPVVEIKNRPRLGRGPISDIHGTVAMQNAINLLWAYLFGAADHASFPARVVMGTAAPVMPILDKDGQKIGEKPIDIKELQHGRMLWLTGQDAKIGQWDAAKLDVFTQVIEIMVGHIASQARIPAHYFIQNSGLSNVNGETLTATETPLVKKAEEFQLFTSGAIAEVASMMAQAQGSLKLAATLRASSVQWKNPAIRSDAQLADSLAKLQALGYPLEYLMELRGESPDDRKRILEMKRAEASDPDLAQIVDRLNSDSFGG